MLTRRALLVFGLAGAGTIACRRLIPSEHAADTDIAGSVDASGLHSPVALHPLLTLDDDNGITVLIARTEMGQGVSTALPWLLAQEFGVEWSMVRIVHHRFDRTIPMQGTSASRGIYLNYVTYRRVGSAARESLIAAAAGLWSVPPAEITTRDGTLVHTATQRKIRYIDAAQGVPEGAVAAAVPSAAVRPVIPMPALPGLDARDKSTGRAVYGADVRLPGLLYAALRRAPAGQNITGFSDDAARKVSGFRKAFRTRTGVACLADTTWAAHQASKALVLEVSGDRLPTEDLAAMYAAQWETATLQQLRAAGDGRVAARAGDLTIERSYRFPLLAHAALEPMTATALVKQGAAEIWAPMQAPGLTIQVAAEALGVAGEQITVHKTLVGGGFGRKVYQDVIESVIDVAREVVDQPVQLTLTREQDFASDYFRPGSEHRLAASISSDGLILGWHHQVVAPSVLAWYPPTPKLNPKDFLSFSGVGFSTYLIPDFLAEGSAFATRTRVGIWRSIGHSASCYVNETAIDLLARRAGLDPVEVRMRNLRPDSRMRTVLALAAERARWSERESKLRPMGAAIFQEVFAAGADGTPAYEVYVAHVVELAPAGDARWKLSRITCVVDCGEVVCPDTVRAQFEGAVTWALTGLFNEIDVGAADSEAVNFHRYLPTRMTDVPAVDVVVLQTAHHPGGVGEKGVPGVGPAIANAIAHASGETITVLPWPSSTLAPAARGAAPGINAEG